jgi:hypothetical protein
MVVAVKKQRGRFNIYATDRSIETPDENMDENMYEKAQVPTFLEKRSELKSGMITTVFVNS